MVNVTSLSIIFSFKWSIPLDVILFLHVFELLQMLHLLKKVYVSNFKCLVLRFFREYQHL